MSSFPRHVSKPTKPPSPRGSAGREPPRSIPWPITPASKSGSSTHYRKASSPGHFASMSTPEAVDSGQTPRYNRLPHHLYADTDHSSPTDAEGRQTIRSASAMDSSSGGGGNGAGAASGQGVAAATPTPKPDA